MSIFGRRPDPGRERTPEERERARREREARRAAREGRPPPVFDDEPSANGNAAAEPQAPAPDPPAGDGEWPPAAEPPTLGDELSAVEARGTPSWFEDPATAGGGQETVEWDPFARDHGHDESSARGAGEPPAASGTPPAGEAPPASGTPEVGEASGTPLAGEVHTSARERAADETPASSGAGEARAPDRTPAADEAPPSGGTQPSDAGTPPRFGDEHERPVPTRRVSRHRTLPPPSPGPGERRRRRSKLPIVAGVVLLGLVVAVLWFVNGLFQPLAGEGGEPVRVTIPEDSTVAEVAEVLEREGVVDSAFFFRLRTRLDGASLQAGDYELRADMPYGDVLDKLAAGPAPPPVVRITIPEGRARRETAPLVRESGLRGSYMKASERFDGFDPRRYGAPRKVPSLEGFLFPATYELKPGSTARQLVREQLRAFNQNIEQVPMRRARARNLTVYDVLIIASMVEREATLARERRVISAVIHNRLRQGMPLGIDATIRYATRNWDRPLKQSELDIDSPYNTRRRTGLPPTPIGSPGLESIKAAANPADVDYLYYVVKPNGDGAHAFSSTEEQFQRDVAAYHRERERRGGRSPAESE